MMSRNPLDVGILYDHMKEHIEVTGGLLSLSPKEVFEIVEQVNKRIYGQSKNFETFHDYWMAQDEK